MVLAGPVLAGPVLAVAGAAEGVAARADARAEARRPSGEDDAVAGADGVVAGLAAPVLPEAFEPLEAFEPRVVCAFADAFTDGLGEVAVRVTAGAMPGDRVPALLCQANASDPPARTLSPSTPELA